MKKLVIDLNILIDFLFKREGHEKVAELFAVFSKNDVLWFICAHEITTLYYFLSKSIKDKRKVKKSTSLIMNRFKVIEVNDELLAKALSSEIDDFEDAVIEASAKGKNADYIVTRNFKDFKKSMVNAISPEELLFKI